MGSNMQTKNKENLPLPSKNLLHKEQNTVKFSNSDDSSETETDGPTSENTKAKLVSRSTNKGLINKLVLCRYSVVCLDYFLLNTV